MSHVNAETENKILELYHTTALTNAEIAEVCGVTHKVVYRLLDERVDAETRNARKRMNYSVSKLGNKNPMLGKTREQHPRYKGVVEDGNGYLMIGKPEWYTGRKGSKHVFLHSVVMCEHLGLTEIPKGFVIHHIDGDTRNNDIDNLALMTVSGHGKTHTWKEQRLEETRRELREQYSEAHRVSRQVYGLEGDGDIVYSSEKSE